MIDKIVNKLLSGKFLLTVACSFVLIYAVVTKILSDAAIVGIIMMVYTAYFNRKKEGDKNA